jgi:hypothetical protein
MKIPHPGLMRMYGTSDVFFEKAAAGPRVADQIGRLFAGELLEKIALPMAPGMKPLALKPPTQAMRAPAAAMGLKPPTTAPVQTPARPKTQMQAPLPGALKAPASQAAPTTGPMPAAPGSNIHSPETLSKLYAENPAKAPNSPERQALRSKIQASRAATGMAPNAPASKPGTAITPAAPEPTAAPSKGVPWNRILAVGGALGAGALGLSALNSGLKFLGGHGPSAPSGYGYAPGGYQVPMGVNGYGAPQPGSPMM